MGPLQQLQAFRVHLQRAMDQKIFEEGDLSTFDQLQAHIRNVQLGGTGLSHGV